jgi:hypothetical protein
MSSPYLPLADDALTGELVSDDTLDELTVDWPTGAGDFALSSTFEGAGDVQCAPWLFLTDDNGDPLLADDGVTRLTVDWPTGCGTLSTGGVGFDNGGIECAPWIFVVAEDDELVLSEDGVPVIVEWPTGCGFFGGSSTFEGTGDVQCAPWLFVSDEDGNPVLDENGDRVIVEWPTGCGTFGTGGVGFEDVGGITGSGDFGTGGASFDGAGFQPVLGTGDFASGGQSFDGVGFQPVLGSGDFSLPGTDFEGDGTVGSLLIARSRGRIRPISDLREAQAPVWVEAQDADGRAVRAPYFAGGGTKVDLWRAYGTPLWRYDFTNIDSLNDWSVVQGDKGNLAFRTNGKEGGAWSSSGNIWLQRSAPSVPFVYDVRLALSRPSSVRFDVGGGVGGASNARTIFTAGAQFTNYDGSFLNTRKFVNLFQVPGVASGGVSQRVMNGWVTLRTHYTGTHYRFLLCDGPPWAASLLNEFFQEAQTLHVGAPTNVLLCWGINGINARILFAQMQTENVDDYVGM